ncbi:MAG: threonine aldolase [Gemmataceae bacterium]|jgi:D-serine deaminase-like pyridoxal phosphate-dependent protein|uniref:D-TA family PLP-dependent enzyme n=1 Tax=Thermogemmata fonticola TaxID=2755323 RepID=A0A7V9ACQ3_9BACT|nr:D-TA family PLP-dependent enzyme [Thermogemmata fonticola]MBA2227433.1 D-TA family PLP-dependent enzyme [Thermogemmata fonticola]GIW84059.1 MAG: threonine aldolase [Gemmataceae bacterium]
MAVNYRLEREEEVYSPALLVYPALIRQNIACVLRWAGGPQRLCPHVKTHKTREIARWLLEAGVQRHKCATLAEAEMLAQVGAPQVLIAYPLVGPNLQRLAALIRRYPHTHFATLVDHPAALAALASAMQGAGTEVGVLLDLNVGQDRTGIAVGPEAAALYQQMCRSPGVRPEGFHVYDGHNNAPERSEREATAERFWKDVLALRRQLEEQGCPVPRLVVGGTPSFPVHSRWQQIPGLECSPGTFVLHDAGYGSKYADLAELIPAAALMTRVISRPHPRRVTLDLGTKAVAADPPLERRVRLLDVPEYTVVAHNEEHLVIETPAAEQFQIGDVLYALPGHICPTVALYRELLVVENGIVADRWLVAARDRSLTV